MRFATPGWIQLCTHNRVNRPAPRVAAFDGSRWSSSCSCAWRRPTSTSARPWSEVEDGVLWRATGNGVVAAEVAPGRPPRGPGIRSRATCSSPSMASRSPGVDDVVHVLHASGDRAASLHATPSCACEAAPDVDVAVDADSVRAARALYYVLAAVGIFSLLVGASVRLRRPDNQATLHFFWLTVAFFGMLAFSFSGRWTRSTGSFYWADIVGARSCCRRCSCISRWCSRIGPTPGCGATPADRVCRACICRRCCSARASVAGVVNGARHGDVLERLASLVQSGELVYLAVEPRRRPGDHDPRAAARAIGDGAAAAALDRRGARRSARCRSSFGYALPFALGLHAAARLRTHGAPARPRAAGVRVGHRPLPADGRRGDHQARAGLCGGARGDRRDVRDPAASWRARCSSGTREQRSNPVIALLATLVVVLLSRPVKNAIQAGLDRVYYRDRYDYRRALVGFARDLNSDLDLLRLSERLVHRVMETLVVDRMALMLAPASMPADERRVRHHRAHRVRRPAAARCRGRRTSATRLIAGHTLSLDDPFAQRRIDARGDRVLARGRDPLLRAVRLEGRDHRGDGARPQGQQRAAQQRGHGAAGGGGRAGGDRARERPAVPAAARQGGRARADARVQREHPRVAERRPRGASNRDDRIVRWNRRLEELYGVRHEDAVGRALDESVRPAFLEVLRSARRESPEGRGVLSRAADRRGTSRRAGCSSTSATTPLRDSRRGDRRHHRHRRGHLGARAARGAAADFREDGVDRPARRRRRPRGQHAADRHLELHADAAPGRRAGRSAAPRCSRRSSGRRSAPRRSSTAC